MCQQRVTICNECKKDTDGLMTCTYPDGEEIQLCPDCLKADGSYCLSCGCFCSGIESFDFIHPGFCDDCWDEIEADDFWGDDDWDGEDPDFEYGEYDEEDFPNGSLDY